VEFSPSSGYAFRYIVRENEKKKTSLTWQRKLIALKIYELLFRSLDPVIVFLAVAKSKGYL